MNWRSPRFLFPLLAFFLLLIVGATIAIMYLRSVTSTDNTIVWQSSPASLTQQDKQDIQNAWKAAILAPNPNHLAGHVFSIIDAQRQGDWAIFSANERVNQNAQPIPTEPLFFIAHRQGTTWIVSIPSSSDFCNQLKQIPDTLLDPIDKHYFLGCYH